MPGCMLHRKPTKFSLILESRKLGTGQLLALTGHRDLCRNPESVDVFTLNSRIGLAHELRAYSGISLLMLAKDIRCLNAQSARFLLNAWLKDIRKHMSVLLLNHLPMRGILSYKNNTCHCQQLRYHT